MRHDPYFIESVVRGDGEMLYRNADKPEQAVSSQHSRIVTDVLTQVVNNGPATAAAIPDRQVAARQGRPMRMPTPGSSGSRPGCPRRCGEAPRARMSMYNVGAFPRVYGGTYPARISGECMRSVLAEQPAVPFPPPEPPTRLSNALIAP